MKILMLAWRDMKNPIKGGAEVITDTYLKGLSDLGHEVTLFTAEFDGGLKKEYFNGYKILRKGDYLKVYLHGLLYAFKNRKKYDVIIDQINTLPFATFLLISNKKRVCFFHQLCQNVWFWERKFPVAHIGYILENIYLWFYRYTKTIVVSKSTKDDLVSRGFKNVHIIENGIDLKPIDKLNKKNRFQLCYVGRLKNSKRVHDCIKTVNYLKKDFPKIKLKVVGVGDRWYVKELKDFVKKNNLEENVEFCGRVSFEDRNKIMGESEAILVTSIREGWGLIVTEANANGTVAFTYNIHGLRDANRTGVIVKKNTSKVLASKLKKYLEDKKKITEMSKRSLEDSHNFTDWNYRIKRFEKILKR